MWQSILNVAYTIISVFHSELPLHPPLSNALWRHFPRAWQFSQYLGQYTSLAEIMTTIPTSVFQHLDNYQRYIIVTFCIVIFCIVTFASVVTFWGVAVPNTIYNRDFRTFYSHTGAFVTPLQVLHHVSYFSIGRWGQERPSLSQTFLAMCWTSRERWISTMMHMPKSKSHTFIA